MSDRVILHCDLNNFYASVEMLLKPELKGKSIAVCGDPEKRHGIVLAKSEPAKRLGVKDGYADLAGKATLPRYHNRFDQSC
jgi:DNA polymerase-4